MSSYRVADGHDVALGSLSVIEPQPKSTGIQATRRSYAADGTVTDEGLYVELSFDVLKDAAMYQSVLNQFGVQSARTNPVTVYVRDDTFAWVRMNGVAVRPEMGRDAKWDKFFPRSVVILVKDLGAAS